MKKGTIIIGKFKPTFVVNKSANMSYEITGKLVDKFDIVQRTENFKNREFVIEKTEEGKGHT